MGLESILTNLPSEIEKLKRVYRTNTETISKFNQLKVTYEELRRSIDLGQKTQGSLAESVVQMQRDVSLSGQRTLSLKAQAEKRLKDSNEQMIKIKELTEAQAYLADFKLKAAEAKANSFRERIAALEKENQNILIVCDQMLQKLEQIEPNM